MPIDYKKYPPNWKTEIRPAVLKRAHNRCEFCGVENHSIRPDGVKVVLTIAHLDHDEENWNVSLDRLRALCQRCHLRYDSEDRGKRMKLKEKHHDNTRKM